jgi:hypothetical protein
MAEPVMSLSEEKNTFPKAVLTVAMVAKVEKL